MKMKNLLLFLSALIFAVPAWAADTADAPASASSAQAAPAAQSGKKTPKKAKKKKKKAKSAATESVSPMGCPTGCAMMPCPSITKCCNTTTHAPC